MRILPSLPLALLAALFIAAPASANYRVGLSEQSPRVFSDPNWQHLKLKRVRYIIGWDWYKNAGQVSEADQFLSAAHAARQEILLAFTAHRGCFVNGRYSRSKVCRAPSTRAYTSAVKRFRATYPFVKLFTPWNEANHVSQPTAKKPQLAAAYYRALKSACRGCTVMAADVLDNTDVGTWLRGFRRASKGQGSIWGLHNYKDVNRRQSRGLTNVMRAVRGQVWLTETGGIVTFLPSFKTSSSRASSATKYMFSLANRYSRVKRVYVYRWYGEPPGARFDAGLVSPDGTPRASFKQFVSGLAHHQR